MTTAEVEALLLLLTDMERVELELVMLERRDAEREGRLYCVICLVDGDLWLKLLPFLDVNGADRAAGVFQQNRVINDA